MAFNKAAGVVAAGHPATAHAAADILRAGGNAFDAAIAGVVAACVAEPVLASLGGGGFLMAYDAQKNCHSLFDFFAETPGQKRPAEQIDFYAVEVNFGPVTQEFHIGAGAAAIPSLVPGLFAVHKALGRLPFSVLLQPAIKAARMGLELTPFQAYLLTVVAPILTASPESQALFAPDGKLLQAGQRFVNLDFALMLEHLGESGADLFRSGDVATALLGQSEAHGGHLTAMDLMAYKSEIRQPLRVDMGTSSIALNPPPSGGGALVGFGLAVLERGWPEGQRIGPVEMAQVMQETNRARRKGVSVSTNDLAQHVARLRQMASVQRGTTHISVLDGEGNGAALTVSNGEGNGQIVPGTGFMLNNMLGEEDVNPAGLGSWPPRTRLSSMMAPTIIRDQDGTLTVLGSGGSNRIRTAILQVITHLLRGGMSLEDAVNAPRLHLEKTGKLSLEAVLGGFTEEVIAALGAAYPDIHQWKERNVFFGGVHVVRRFPDGRVEGAGDPRREGVVIKVED